MISPKISIRFQNDVLFTYISWINIFSPHRIFWSNFIPYIKHKIFQFLLYNEKYIHISKLIKSYKLLQWAKTFISAHSLMVRNMFSQRASWICFVLISFKSDFSNFFTVFLQMLKHFAIVLWWFGLSWCVN